jgi:hypothetical protein
MMIGKQLEQVESVKFITNLACEGLVFFNRWFVYFVSKLIERFISFFFAPLSDLNVRKTKNK